MNVDLAKRFHALADPTRLGILERLLRGERCVCELTDALDAAQSRLSFHLRVLREAGLIRGRRAGRWIYYALVPGAFEALQQELAPFASASSAAVAGDDGCCTAPVLLRGRPAMTV